MSYEFVLKQLKTPVVRKVNTQLITVNGWFKKFCLGCKKLDNQARSGWSKTVDSEAVLQATEVEHGQYKV